MVTAAIPSVSSYFNVAKTMRFLPPCRHTSSDVSAPSEYSEAALEPLDELRRPIGRQTDPAVVGRGERVGIYRGQSSKLEKK